MKRFMKKYSANKEMPIFEYFSSKRNKPKSAFFIAKSIFVKLINPHGCKLKKIEIYC